VELDPVETWELPADLGRRYAAVAGDRNPIHLYDITAKPLGFKRAIIHGMWTKARSLAALGEVPDAHTVEVKFLKPIFLPGKVEFLRGDEDFAVRDAASGTPHLAGTIRGL
jgi:acyl dehydratase